MGSAAAWTPVADTSAWIPVPETPKESSPVMDQVAGVGRSLANQAKGAFDTLSSLVDPHMGQKIGDAVIDSHIHEWNKAKEEYSKGNYGAALTRGLGAAVPILGPFINQTAEKMTSGKPGAVAEGATDILAPMLLVKAAEVAPEVAGAVKEHVGNFFDVVKNVPEKVSGLASNPKVMGTAGAAVGASMGHATGIPYGGAGGAALGGMAGKALADMIGESKTMPPPEILDRLSLTPKEFKALPMDAKAQVIELANRMQEKPIRSIEFAKEPPTGPVDTGPQVPKGPTMQERLAADIAARKPQPQAVGPRTPIWQRGDIQPAQIPAGPVDPTVAPQTRTAAPAIEAPQAQAPYVQKLPEAAIAPAQGLAEALTGSPEGGVISPGTIHPPPEAFEGTYRAKRAQILADQMHKAGITYAEAANLTPEHMTPSQWETLLGKDPETGLQYRIPSQKTIDQARVRLAHKYAAGRSAAAMGPASELAIEMAKPTVGSTVTLKDGTTGIIKSIAPDGSMEIR